MYFKEEKAQVIVLLKKQVILLKRKQTQRPPMVVMLILFGKNSQHDFCIEDEEVNNDDLLSQITTSLRSANDTGPPVSDKLSKLVNYKFQNYTVENRKEILQKYKVPINCNELFVPKVNSENKDLDQT